MNARFWLIALLSIIAILAFGVIYSAVNDPEVKRFNILKVGESDSVNETMIDQARNVSNDVSDQLAK